MNEEYRVAGLAHARDLGRRHRKLLGGEVPFSDGDQVYAKRLAQSLPVDTSGSVREHFLIYSLTIPRTIREVQQEQSRHRLLERDRCCVEPVEVCVVQLHRQHPLNVQVMECPPLRGSR